MGVRVLADKKHKFTILTTKPAIEASPTLIELAAGIEACSKVLFDGFRFTPTDSGTQGAKALCGSNEEVFTDENFTVSYAFWRYFLALGGADPADDVLFAACFPPRLRSWLRCSMNPQPRSRGCSRRKQIRADY